MPDNQESPEESDNDTDPVSIELKEEEATPLRRISLTMGEQAVEIVGPDDLQTIANLAASLWLMTAPPDRVRTGFTAGETLYTERAPVDLPEQDEEE
jgi:hypothetical protein